VFNVGVQAKPQLLGVLHQFPCRKHRNPSWGLRERKNAVQVGLGPGTNFSALPRSKETLSGEAIASGPVSFMKGLMRLRA